MHRNEDTSDARVRLVGEFGSARAPSAPRSAASAKRRNCCIGGMVVSVLALVCVAYLTTHGHLTNQSRSLASAASLHASPTSSRPGARNPYSVENDTLVREPHMLTGYLQASPEKLEDFARFAEESRSAPKASGPWDVDPRLIPTGPNNEIIKRVRFEVG